METQYQIRAERAARRAKIESNESRLDDSVTSKGTSDPKHTYESYHALLWRMVATFVHPNIIYQPQMWAVRGQEHPEGNPAGNGQYSGPGG